MKKGILWVYHKVRNTDMYGKQISLSYKGEEKLRTFYGGVISIMIMIALLINFCTSMYTLINRNNNKTDTKTIFKHTFDDTTK